MWNDESIGALVQRLVQRTRPRKVIVFGSCARGTQTPSSDLDLLIIKDTALPMVQRIDDLKLILSRCAGVVDVHVYTPEEVDVYANEAMSFLNSVMKSGRTVYDEAVASP